MKCSNPFNYVNTSIAVNTIGTAIPEIADTPGRPVTADLCAYTSLALTIPQLTNPYLSIHPGHQQ